jgi:hypothetical protein
MQLNIRTDPEFERELDALVRKTGARTRTAAIKQAVRVALERVSVSRRRFDFRDVIGIAGKPNPRARFRSDDDLYKDQMP